MTPVLISCLKLIWVAGFCDDVTSHPPAATRCSLSVKYPVDPGCREVGVEWAGSCAAVCGKYPVDPGCREVAVVGVGSCAAVYGSRVP